MSRQSPEENGVVAPAEPAYVQKIWEAITPEYFEISEKKGREKTPAECISTAELSRLFDYLSVKELIEPEIILGYLDNFQNKGLEYALASVINPLLVRFFDFDSGQLSNDFIKKLGEENYNNMIRKRMDMTKDMTEEKIKKNLAFQVFCAVKNIINKAVIDYSYSDPRVLLESTLTATFDNTFQLHQKLELFKKNEYQFTYKNALIIRDFFHSNGQDLIDLGIFKEDQMDALEITNFAPRLNRLFPLEKTDDLYAQFYFENLRLTQTKIIQKLDNSTLSGEYRSKLESLEQKIATIIGQIKTDTNEDIPKTFNFLSEDLNYDLDIPSVSDAFANEFSQAIGQLTEISNEGGKKYQILLQRPDAFKTLDKTLIFKAKYKSLECLAGIFDKEDPAFFNEADDLIRLTRNENLRFLFDKFAQKTNDKTQLFKAFVTYQKDITNAKINDPEELAAFYQKIICHNLVISTAKLEPFQKFNKFLKNNHIGNLFLLEKIYDAITPPSSPIDENQEDCLENFKKELLLESLNLSFERGGDLKKLYDQYQTIIPNQDLHNALLKIKEELIENELNDNNFKDTQAYKNLLKTAIKADIDKQNRIFWYGIASAVITAGAIAVVATFTFGAGLALIPVIYSSIAMAFAGILGIGGGRLGFSEYKKLSTRITENKVELDKILSQEQSNQLKDTKNTVATPTESPRDSTDHEDSLSDSDRNSYGSFYTARSSSENSSKETSVEGVSVESTSSKTRKRSLSDSTLVYRDLLMNRQKLADAVEEEENSNLLPPRGK